jgi:hypothetical protein
MTALAETKIKKEMIFFAEIRRQINCTDKPFVGQHFFCL